MRIDDEDGRNDLLIYANEQFRGADRIRFLVDDFSAEIIALELKFRGVRVRREAHHELSRRAPEVGPALRGRVPRAPERVYRDGEGRHRGGADPLREGVDALGRGGQLVRVSVRAPRTDARRR